MHAPVSGCGSPCKPQDVAHGVAHFHASWCGSLSCLMVWLTSMPHGAAHHACWKMWLTVCSSWCGSLCIPHGVAHFHASRCVSLHIPQDVTCCACCPRCGSPCMPHDVAHCACLKMWLTVHASWCGSPCMPQDMAHCACLMSLAVAAFEISLAEWVHFSISMGGLVCSRLHGLIQVSLHRARQLGHSPILCAGHYPGGHALQTESTRLSAQTVWGFFGSRRQQESRQVVHKLIDDKSWQREREQSKRREQVDLWLFKDWIQVGWFVFQWYACGCVWD